MVVIAAFALGMVAGIGLSIWQDWDLRPRGDRE